MNRNGDWKNYYCVLAIVEMSLMFSFPVVKSLNPYKRSPTFVLQPTTVMAISKQNKIVAIFWAIFYKYYSKNAGWIQSWQSQHIAIEDQSKSDSVIVHGTPDSVVKISEDWLLIIGHLDECDSRKLILRNLREIVSSNQKEIFKILSSVIRM